MKWTLIKVIPIAAYAQMVASVGHDPPRVLSRYSASKHTSPKCWPRCATPDNVDNMQAPQPPSETQRFENKVKSYSQVAERFESQRVLNINHDINPMPIENVNVKTSYEMKKADEVSTASPWASHAAQIFSGSVTERVAEYQRRASRAYISACLILFA